MASVPMEPFVRSMSVRCPFRDSSGRPNGHWIRSQVHPQTEESIPRPTRGINNNDGRSMTVILVRVRLCRSSGRVHFDLRGRPLDALKRRNGRTLFGHDQHDRPQIDSSLTNNSMIAAWTDANQAGHGNDSVASGISHAG